jgi:fermentation-respiration switch protein FrsA (DUF1100 family)
MRKDIEFDAAGTTLRGWLYRPDSGNGPFPTVVMAHGLSVVKEMGLDDYADVFAAAGLAVVAYDNRNLGASDGQPRQEIDPVMQRRDYSHAITWAAAQADIDATRIGVWGTSYTGGLAIISGALDHRVRCVVAQVPYLHALQTQDLVSPLEGIKGFHRLIERERQSLADGNAPRMVEVCSDDESKPANSASALSWAFFNHYLASGRAPNWKNELTIRSLELRQEYDALSFVHRVSPKPLLMIVAEDDDITPTSIALAAFERAREPKHLVMVAGHHYRPYIEAFEASSAAARDWFIEHL